MIKLLSILLVGFIILPLSAEKYRIAILDFKKGNEISTEEAELISGLVRTKMVKQKNFTVIDRENVSKVFKEQALVQKGCTDSSCEVQIGKLLAANKIMTGSVAKLGNSYVINALVTDVEKGTTEVGENETVSSMDEMNKAVGRLTEKITEAMIADLPESKKPVMNIPPIPPLLKSVIFPGWGQFSNGYKWKGSIFAISFFGSIGLLASSMNEYNSEKERYNGAANLSIVLPSDLSLLGYVNAKNVFSEYEASTVQVRNVSIAVVGVYIINLLDILFFSKAPSIKPVFRNDKTSPGAENHGLQFYVKTSPITNQSLDNSYTIQYSWRF